MAHSSELHSGGLNHKYLKLQIFLIHIPLFALSSRSYHAKRRRAIFSAKKKKKIGEKKRYKVKTAEKR
jgi:hypothetical protein